MTGMVLSREVVLPMLPVTGRGILSEMDKSTYEYIRSASPVPARFRITENPSPSPRILHGQFQDVLELQICAKSPVGAKLDQEEQKLQSDVLGARFNQLAESEYKKPNVMGGGEERFRREA